MIRRPISLFLAAIFYLTALHVSANEVRLPANMDQVGFTKVADKIYVLHGLHEMPNAHNHGLISNSGIIVTDAGVVVVDSGGGYEIGKLIVEKVKELTPKPIITVFNSHIHGDHWMGNAAIRESFPKARIYAHQRAIERLKEGSAENWRQIMDGMTGNKEKRALVLPDAPLEGNETIDVGGTRLKMHHTGHAHTDSDVMIEVPSDKLLFTGDVVEYGRLVSSDVPEDFNAKGQIEAIKYMLALPVDIYVPGHGETGGKEIPEAALRFLETLYSSVKRYYDEGLADYQMKEKVSADLAEFKDWFNFDLLGKMISFVFQQVEQDSF